MDYSTIVADYFIFDPSNNEKDKILLENLKQYEEQFNMIFNEKAQE